MHNLAFAVEMPWRSWLSSRRLTRNWVERNPLTGMDEPMDHSSRPHLSPVRLPESRAESVKALRQQHLPGYQIARRTGGRADSVSRIW